MFERWADPHMISTIWLDPLQGNMSRGLATSVVHSVGRSVEQSVKMSVVCFVSVLSAKACDLLKNHNASEHSIARRGRFHKWETH